MRLSEHFTLAEMTRSQLAARRGLDNEPDPRALTRLRFLAANVLQPLRDAAQRPVTVTSGYRSPALCKLLGSSRSSTHTFGLAADIHIAGMSPRDVARLAVDTPTVRYGRIILEFPEDGWVHIEAAHPICTKRDGPLLIASRHRYWTGYRVVESF